MKTETTYTTENITKIGKKIIFVLIHLITTLPIAIVFGTIGRISEGILSVANWTLDALSSWNVWLRSNLKI